MDALIGIPNRMLGESAFDMEGKIRAEATVAASAQPRTGASSSSVFLSIAR